MMPAVLRVGAFCLALLLPAVAVAKPAEELLRSKGCLACHSTDGRAGPGPTFAGLAGKSQNVVSEGHERAVVVDREYVRRSILDPDADVVVGWSPGAMPNLHLSEANANALADAVMTVGAEPSAPPAKQRAPWWLALALGAFVGSHFALAASPIKRPLVSAVGENPARGIYSLVALATFGWALWEFAQAPYVELFRPPPFTRWIPNVVMPIALVLLVAAFTTKNPGAVGMERAAAAGPVGIIKVTRHPALWGFLLFALSHLTANGDLRCALLFGSIAILATGGMLHIDARRRAGGGEAWTHFERQTSLIPFAAVLGGRQRLSLGEIGLWRIAVGLAVWAAFLHLHRFVIGVSAMPNL